MIFSYRKYAGLIFQTGIYAIVVFICFWVMITMIKKYINNRKKIGRREAFNQSWYHFFPMFVVFILISVVFIYGTLTEIGGYYKVQKDVIKVKYILGRFGSNRDVKISDIKNIDFYKQITSDKLGYKKLKEAVEKGNAYKDKGKGGFAGYSIAYIRMKNGQSACIILRLTNKSGQSLAEYLIKNYKVNYKIKPYKQLNKDQKINDIN